MSRRIPTIGAATIVLIWILNFGSSSGFLTTNGRPTVKELTFHGSLERNQQGHYRRSLSSSTTARHVWWYGGSETVEAGLDTNADSCELVAVRIERTSANSRRIHGDITIAAPLRDVWAILTDYNRLAIHVPNLVESRIERVTSANGEMGDGQFQCRLYQKGAQRIIGFEFGASVTMDMREVILSSLPSTAVPTGSGSSSQERKITFKCFDSFFFKEFDGEWKVQESVNRDGDVETLLSYVVDVRPKGPVPVAALEWRIREDVPTNLRAVKKAALTVGYDGVMNTRRPARIPTSSALAVPKAATTQRVNPGAARLAFVNDARGKVQWYKDETMEAYLTDK